MGNTGRLICTELVEVDIETGELTGRVKPNLPEDPDYIPPIEDPQTCPIPTEPIIATTTTTISQR